MQQDLYDPMIDNDEVWFIYRRGCAWFISTGVFYGDKYEKGPSVH